MQGRGTNLVEASDGRCAILGHGVCWLPFFTLFLVTANNHLWNPSQISALFVAGKGNTEEKWDAGVPAWGMCVGELFPIQ